MPSRAEDNTPVNNLIKQVLSPTFLSLAYPKIYSDDRYGNFWGCIFYKHGKFSPLYQFEIKKNITAGKGIQFRLISYTTCMYGSATKQ